MNEEREIKEQKEYIEKVKKINNGKNLKYAILTMGCQLNENDSEKISGMIEQMGYTKTENPKEADLNLFNTCCVRENAEDRLFGKLGELKKIKEEKGTIIAIGGCMMQEKHITDKIKESYPFVDILFGTHTIHKFPEDLHKVLETKQKQEDILDIDGKIYEGLPIKRESNLKASVTIMNGCNNFCSYCIVPYVRGRERSRNPEDIVKEVEELVSNGVVEVMLLGQNVNSYGKTLDNPISFAKLLEMVEQVEGLKRIRFMTSHPKDLSDELIEVMAKSKKICKQMHLPLQSGSSRLLKIMNRHYDKEQYLTLVDKLRAAIPDIGISTDIIVGFPGETDEDFEETLDVVRKAKYDSAFTFIYSKRSGTPAATMPDQVPEDVVKERFDRLLNLVNEISREKTKHLEGTVQSVLVEELNKKIPGYVTGRLSNNSVVHFEGCKELIGKIVDVNLKEAKGFYYMGEMVK